MTKYIINGNVVFSKAKKDGNSYSATYLDSGLGDEKNHISVYRTTIYYSEYSKKWSIGSGWNLFKNLPKLQAIKAAKAALKYI